MGVNRFAVRPVLGDDLVMAGCDKETSYCGIGAIDEDSVEYAAGIWGVVDADEPVRLESAVESSLRDTHGVGDVVEVCGSGGVGMEDCKVASQCVVSVVLSYGASVGGFTSPSDGSFGRGAVFFIWSVHAGHRGLFRFS